MSDLDTLPRERGARARSRPRSYWTEGAKVREPSRSPWDRPRTKPKYIVPKYNPFERRKQDADIGSLPDWLRRQLDRERRGVQWTNRLAAPLRAAMAADEIINSFAGGFAKDRYVFNVPGMTRCDGPHPPARQPANGIWWAIEAVHCQPTQLLAQGFGGGEFIALADLAPGMVRAFTNTYFPNNAMLGHTVEAGARWDEHSSFTHNPDWQVHRPIRLEVQGQIIPADTAIGAQENPNVTRWRQPDLQPAPIADYSTATGLAPDLAPEFETRPEPFTMAHLLASAPAEWAFSAPSTGTGGNVQVNVPSPAPPNEQTKERKVYSRSRALGAMMYKALDKMSEGAEIVDAMYEALPDNVKKRWKCDRSAPFIDNAGQYGIDNADCKSAALWHNFHKMDVDKAVKNIIKNEVEDRAYGFVHRHLPKQGGSAFHEQWKLVGKLKARLESALGI